MFRLHASGAFTYAVQRHPASNFLMEHTPLDRDSASIVDAYCPDMISEALNDETLVSIFTEDRTVSPSMWTAVPPPDQQLAVWAGGVSLYESMRQVVRDRLRALVRVRQVNAASGAMDEVAHLDVRLGHTEGGDRHMKQPGMVHLARVVGLRTADASAVDLLPTLWALLPKAAGSVATLGGVLLQRTNAPTKTSLDRFQLSSFEPRLRLHLPAGVSAQLEFVFGSNSTDSFVL